MKIICAPDSYKESVTAADAASAMADGIMRSYPHAQVDRCPVADGGEGTVDAVVAARGGQYRTTSVKGPLGQPVEACWALIENGEVAVIEIAAAAGLTLTPRYRRDPTKTTSYGVGQLLLAACETGVRSIIIGVGGSATNDGGCGMAQALGVTFLDQAGRKIVQPIAGYMLKAIARIDAAGRSPSLNGVTLTVASDVRNPLTGAAGAAHVFAAQKGADERQIRELDAGLVHLAEVIRRDLGVEVEQAPGAGSAGGLGAGLMAFAGATIESGIDLVLEAVGFHQRVRGCTVCLTGEGRLDGQSLSGKACLGVARVAARYGVPTIALVGSTGPGADRVLAAGLTDYIVIGEGLPARDSMRRAPELLAAAAARAVERYCGS